MVYYNCTNMAEQNGATTDESETKHRAADLETIVVSKEAVLEALRRNKRDENEQLTHMLRVSPPFEGEKRATHHVDEHHKRYPSDITTPLHIRPERFVGEGRQLPAQCKVPDYSQDRRMFVEENEYVDEQTGETQEWTDEMESEFEDWWEVTNEVFETNVKHALSDGVEFTTRTPDGNVSTTIAVRYEAEDE